jgi:hypothetical protein
MRFPDITHRCGAGEVLDERYVLKAPLGAGGAGVVWSAEHLSHGGRVAIKVLGEQRDVLLTQRLRREADLLQSVRHLGLVRVYDIVECDVNGLPALIMELLRGEDLARRMDRVRALPAVQLATLLLPAVDALVALHQRAIAHRDLKPFESLHRARRELIVRCLSISRERRPAMKELRDELTALAAVRELPAGAFKRT